MSKEFQQFISRYPPQKVNLPLIHTTSSYSFRSIVNKGCLSLPRRSTSLKKQLLYLFYGRPAYRSADQKGTRTDIAYCPVCFVFKPGCIGSIERIYPFDSGAFDDKRYRQHMYKGMQIDDFNLGNSIEMAKRMITAFFGSNRNYYFGTVKPGLKIDFSDMEAVSYYDLISDTGELEHDDRGYTIEIQTKHEIIIVNNIMAVVLPTSALDDSGIRDIIVRTWKATPITYDLYRGVSPSEYHPVIRHELARFFESRGFL